MMHVKSLLREKQEEAASNTEQDLFTSCPISTRPTLRTEPSPGGRERRKRGAWLTTGYDFLAPTYRQPHMYLSSSLHKKQHSHRRRESVPGSRTLSDFHFSPETPVEPFFHPCCPFCHRDTCNIN